jgi:methionyl-tRNA formyltransferase
LQVLKLSKYMVIKHGSMRLAIIISSKMGLPLLQDLVTQGAVAGVAIPRTSHAETQELAAQVQALGLPVAWLARAGLAAAITEWQAALAATAVLVLMFPWRIPAEVLALPPEGFLNMHFAALPGYRGPEPLFWQIRNGEAAGAVTVHRMEADFDTGPIVLAAPVAIGPRDTYGLHYGQLALAAVGVGRQLVAALRGNGPPLVPTKQVPAQAHYWPRPGLADVCVRWEEPALNLDRLVRAVNPWNRGALALLRGQPLRLLSVTPLAGPAPGPPGTVLVASATDGLIVACGVGEALRLDAVALDEGYFTGAQLATLGVQAGEVLTMLPVAQPAMVLAD